MTSISDEERGLAKSSRSVGEESKLLPGMRGDPLASATGKAVALTQTRIRTLILYAAGFEGPPTIIRVGEHFMGTIASQMEITGTSDGYGLGVTKVPVKTVVDFFDALAAAHPLGSSDAVVFSKVVFIGHGNRSGRLGLAGKVDMTQATFSEHVDTETVLGVATDAARVEGMRAHCARGSFDICACEVGLAESFLSALAELLRMRVRALKGAVRWLFKEEKGHAFCTGRLYYEPNDRSKPLLMGPNQMGMTVKELFERVPTKELVTAYPKVSKEQNR